MSNKNKVNLTNKTTKICTSFRLTLLFYLFVYLNITFFKLNFSMLIYFLNNIQFQINLLYKQKNLFFAK